MQLLLLSNSSMPGEAYLEWPRPYVQAFLQGTKKIGFIPFAAPEDQYQIYTDKVAAVFNEIGVETKGLHLEKDPAKALNDVDAIAVGGGNTFLLLKQLYRTGLVRSIPELVKKGMPFLGWSAGSNVACPTIMTTNDMPIVEPPSMRAMHLIGFQINPHYTEGTIAGHGGESRDQRLAEFVALNPEIPVAGLYEGSLIHLDGSKMSVHGNGMKVFRKGKEARTVAGGTIFRKDLSDL